MGGMAKDLQGNPNVGVAVNTLNECEHTCDRSSGCGSLVYCSKIEGGKTNCLVYDKKLSGLEEIDTNIKNGCTSYYKRCKSKGKLTFHHFKTSAIFKTL